MAKITPCILCGFTKFTFFHDTLDRMFGLPGKFFLKKCNQCSLAFLDPQQLEPQLKKYYPSKKYYAYNKDDTKGFFQILREYLVKNYYSPTFLSKIIALLIKNVPAMPSNAKNGKILDLECGTGDTLMLLKKLGWDTYGIDIDKQAISIGINRGLKNLKLGTYRDLATYPDNYFDVVRLYHVIEHLDNPALCLSLIRKKLKKMASLFWGPQIYKVLPVSYLNPVGTTWTLPDICFFFRPVPLEC